MSCDALDHYCSAAESLRRDGNATGHYEDLLFALSEAGTILVHARHCPGMPWTEIDAPSDLNRAKYKVLPWI